MNSIEFDCDDPAQTLNFVKENVKNIYMDNPTLVVLYGPPGSGKTFYKDKIAEQLKNNFIYMSEDYYAYNTIQYKKILNINIDDIQNSTFRAYDKHSIESIEDTEIYKKLQKKYLKIKKRVSHMSNIFTGISLMYGYNVILEMTGAGLDFYVHQIINEFKHYGYILKLYYPYTTEKNKLFERTVERGFTDKRFIPKNILMLHLSVLLKTSIRLLTVTIKICLIKCTYTMLSILTNSFTKK